MAWSEAGDVFVSIDLETRDCSRPWARASAHLGGVCVLGDDVYWFDGDGETYLLDPTTGYTRQEMFADLEDNMKGADCNQETGIVYAASKNTDNRLQITSEPVRGRPVA